MLGWVLAAVLWVLGWPCFWETVKIGDEGLGWRLVALAVWPFFIVISGVIRFWYVVFPPAPRPAGRHYPAPMTNAQMRDLLDRMPAGFGDKQPK